jgi:hypothetical protein
LKEICHRWLADITDFAAFKIGAIVGLPQGEVRAYRQETAGSCMVLLRDRQDGERKKSETRISAL